MCLWSGGLNRRHGDMERIVAGVILLVIVASQASADWTHDMTSSICTEESRQRVAAIARDRIEYSVKRAESSIEPPAPIERLSCLESLMKLPIGTFAPNNALQSLFGNTLNPVHDQSGKLVRRVCAIAEKEWRNTTRPLYRYVHGAGSLNLPGFLGREIEFTQPGSPVEPGGSGQGIVDVGQDDPGSIVPERVWASDEGSMSNELRQDGSRGVEGIWKSIYGGRSDDN